MVAGIRGWWRELLAVAVLVAGGGGAPMAAAQSAEEVARIEAALPEKAPAEPKAPRRVLVFSATQGYRHDSIPCGVKALELLGTRTGAFTTSATEDIAAFDADTLKEFDAVVMLNTTGELFTDPARREALLQFVRGGKGLAGIHAATDCCYQWADYGEMIGGYFDGHPWTAGTTVTVRIEDPKHPVMAAFPEPDFVVQDEIYQMKDPFSREKLNVLASLNTEKTDMTVKGIKRTDGDFPITWVREFGQGRVFYCSLGHNRHIYWNPVVLAHYLAGIQYALGDLKADARPDRPLSAEALLEAFPGLLAEATETTYTGTRGGIRRAEETINAAARYPRVRHEFARQMASWLRANADGPTETLIARQWVGQKLGEIAPASVAGDLAPLLRHDDIRMAEIARKALEKIPGREAGAALRDALAHTGGVRRTGLINSLGVRRDAEAVEALAALLADSDPAQAEAAAHALGRIATPAAMDALAQASRTTTGPVFAAVIDASLRGADTLLRNGDVARAAGIYETVYLTPLPSPMRIPALIGYVTHAGAQGRKAALRELLSDDPRMRAAAAGLLLKAKAPEVTGELVELLRVAPEERRAAIVGILGTRSDRTALPAVLNAASEKSEAVRVAAFQALGRLGDSTVVPLLAETAGTDASAPVRDAARASLASLPTVDVDAAIVRDLEQGAPAGGDREKAAVRAELVKAVLVRRIDAGLPVLFKTAAEENATVAAESFRALAEMAGGDDAGRLLDLLIATRSDRARREAEKAVLASVRRIKNEQERAEPLLAALGRAGDAEATASVVRVLGSFGGKKALRALRQVKRDVQEPAVQDAVVRALADFPTADALRDVREIARGSDNTVHQALAVRGYARMIALQGADRPTSETIADAREALELAKSEEDKRRVLGELAGVGQPGVMALVMPYLDDEKLREDAMAAVVRLADTEARLAPQETSATLARVIRDTASEETRKKARELAEKIEKSTEYIAGWSLAGPYEVTDGKPVLGQVVENAGKAKGKKAPRSRSRRAGSGQGARAEAGIAALLEQVFAPEEPTTASTAAVEWKPVTAGSDDKHPEMVDLLKALGGTNRVAYLRVRIWSPKKQKARLELGSDDGVRAWLNGTLVHSLAETRAYKAATDRLDVSLRKGWNHLMLKVVQGSGDWGASARIVSPEGQKIEGLKLDAKEVENTARFVAPAGGAEAAADQAG